MRFQVQKGSNRRVDVQPTFTQIGENTIIASTHLAGEGGRRSERFQVITFRDGKITDLQGCSSYRLAKRFARRHS